MGKYWPIGNQILREKNSLEGRSSRSFSSWISWSIWTMFSLRQLGRNKKSDFSNLEEQIKCTKDECPGNVEIFHTTECRYLHLGLPRLLTVVHMNGGSHRRKSGGGPSTCDGCALCNAPSTSGLSYSNSSLLGNRRLHYITASLS